MVFANNDEQDTTLEGSVKGICMHTCTHYEGLSVAEASSIHIHNSVTN